MSVDENEGSSSFSLLVSVIIPTYGRTQGLARAVLSVLNQTYSNIEVIIIDDNVDASISAGVKACAAQLNDKRIRLIKRKTNGGGGRARNTGILAARGDLVGFLDDDDYFLPQKIEKQVHQLLRDKAALCTCSLKQVQVQNSIESAELGENFLDGTVTDPEDLVFHSTIFTSMFLAHRQALISVRGFNHSPRYQDKILLLKLMLKGYSFTSVNETLLIMTEHTEARVSRRPMGTSLGKLERTILEEKLARKIGGAQGRKILIRTSCMRSRVLSMEGEWWRPVILNLATYRLVRSRAELKSINKAIRRNFLCRRRQF